MRAIRFQGNSFVYTMNIAKYRRRSKGWQDDPPAYIHSRILFGAGFFITPKFVQDHEITHVINCAFDSDSPQWFKNKFPDKYICLNAVDSLDANILDWYPVFEKALHTFLREPNSKKVYIHCQCGINRSGFLSLAFMTKRLNIEFETGIAVILAQRPCALTNASYKQQVYQFSEANK
jgi:protein-tyrosine phosphatase